MGGKDKSSRKAGKANRKALKGQLGKSRRSGGGFHNDPGGNRESLIAKVWSSFIFDKKK